MSVPDLLRPLLPDLSIGGVLGFCAGFAIKKVGRVMIFALGALFVIVQLLAYFGFLSVNWGRVQLIAEPWLKEGAQQGSAWLLDVLRANLPFGGAFVAGLMLGLRTR
ncbi:FUN14 domain-containing protein [Deinococcus peraridilitoris]|uniref:FUN14 family protein n=1 Tax=Deinococcus peraridilitoris (strain DSM 19664 / LMG 22246 / CIP 109416 / KR-200) TaxID=937777 RepID=L0A0K4_DEIPD|nr:FUN14 domain-containing protein [Deinococcus peraridilitoris]AFZ67376.1 hypothetical protein Deipe_1860 [Deinococcus peraridilitoris DSM 19664]